MDRKFTEQELNRRATLLELQKNNQNPFACEKVNRTCTLHEFNDKYNNYSKEELHNQKWAPITLVGRVMNIRQTFGVIKDFSGTAQFYLNKKVLAPDVFNKFKQIDIGDIVEFIGTPMKTNTDLITLDVNDLKIVSKSLKVLPEKYHGLVDEEIRARNRYVDLIVNDESMQTFIKRSIIIKAIREYMDSLGYFEVETPVLNPILGGAAARPFTTHHNALNREYYLRIATELPLKKCIVGGFEKVYEIGRIFRNEGMDATHNPEFTSIETYEAYADIDDMADMIEGMIKFCAKKVRKDVVNYRGFTIDLTKPFKRVQMVDLINETTGVNFYDVKSDETSCANSKTT